MYRTLILATAGCLAGASALAADLPNRKSPEAFISAPPIFTWTGLYVGLNAGGAFANGNGSTLTPTGFPVGVNAAPAAANILGNNGGNNDGAFVGGAQIGYNWQAGSIVFGVETDIQFLSNNNSNSPLVVAPVAGLAGVVPYAIANTGVSGSRYFGTVRGRLGYAWDRALLYATGGLAYGSSKSNGAVAYLNAFNAGPGPTALYTGSGSGSRVGFTIGAGVEYALTNNWTVKGEYLYADIGRRNSTYVSAALPTTAFVGGNSNRGLHVVRLGVNYKF